MIGIDTCYLWDTKNTDISCKDCKCTQGINLVKAGKGARKLVAIPYVDLDDRRYYSCPYNH